MTAATARSLLLAAFALPLATACGGGSSSPPPAIDPLQSSFTVGTTFGTVADGVSTVALDIVVADERGDPVAGADVTFQVTGFGNVLVADPLTDQDGRASALLASQVGELKTIVCRVADSTGEVVLGTLTTEFVRLAPNTYYVRSSGSDANSGAAPLEAWRNLDFALSRIGAGDTLYVGAGTYPGELSLTLSAADDAPFVLYGDRTGGFTGDAGEVRIEAAGLTHGLELKSCENVVLRGLSVRGADPGAGILIYGTNRRIHVVDCDIYENQLGIDVETVDELTIESNRITNNTGDAIVLRATNSSAIEHNLIYNNALSGIVLTAPSTNFTLQGNTVYRNGGDHFREEVSGGSGRVANNVFAEGGSVGVRLLGGSSFVRTNNLSFANADDALPTGDLIADPEFVDPFGPDGVLGGPGVTDDDFRFLSSSPALDAGESEAPDFVFDFAGPASTRTTLADDSLDGQGTDGPMVNLGFHYPVPLDPFESIATGDARLIFGRPGDAFVHTRSRTPSSWTAEERTRTANREVKWTLTRARNGLQPDELQAVLVDTGKRAELYVRHWDGRRFSEDFPTRIQTNIQSGDTDERGFDLEFEAVSGDAILVHAGPDSNPLFRTWQNGVWSADAQVFQTTQSAGKTLWIELVPNAQNDSIALVALDDQRRLVAAVWDGSGWTWPLLLATEIVETRGFQAFDAAWESLSGDLLVAWGFSVFAEQTRFATLDVTTGAWGTGQFTSTDAIAALLRLDSDPTSDRIVGIFGEGFDDDDVTASIWDGSRWVETVEFTLTGIPEARCLETAWLGTTGEAIAIFREASLTGADFDFAIYRNGWRRQAAVDLPGVQRIVQAEAVRIPGTDVLLVTFLDEAGNLFELTFDGSTWSVGNAGAALAGGLDPSNPGRAFSLDFRRP